MLIAVSTPTGQVGREVLRLLVRAGLRPRALVRDPDRLEPDLREHVDAVVVDLADADAVVAATRGVDALFWVDPPSVSDDPVAAYASFGANAARAIAENSIARTVFQSSVGAEKRGGVGEIDGLARTEELLDATGASVTHLRCGYFFTNLLFDLGPIDRGVFSVTLPVDQPMPWVAPHDIAETAVLRLLSTAWAGRHVQAVHGPADLSWADVARTISEATGRPVRAERISDDALRATLVGSGLPAGMVDGLMGMSTGLRDGFRPEQPRDLTSTTSTTLAAWAYDTLRPLLDAR